MTASTVACPGCDTRNRLPVVTKGRPTCARCGAALPWLVDATGAELDELLTTTSVPVLIDLWAPWCGPCRSMAPVLAQVAGELAGSVRVVKVNVDEEPAVSTRLGVQGIPTLVLHDRGGEIGRQVGALPGPALRAWVEQSLATSTRSR